MLNARKEETKHGSELTCEDEDDDDEGKERKHDQEWSPGGTCMERGNRIK